MYVKRIILMKMEKKKQDARDKDKRIFSSHRQKTKMDISHEKQERLTAFK